MFWTSHFWAREFYWSELSRLQLALLSLELVLSHFFYQKTKLRRKFMPFAELTLVVCLAISPFSLVSFFVLETFRHCSYYLHSSSYLSHYHSVFTNSCPQKGPLLVITLQNFSFLYSDLELVMTILGNLHFYLGEKLAQDQSIVSL